MVNRAQQGAAFSFSGISVLYMPVVWMLLCPPLAAQDRGDEEDSVAWTNGWPVEITLAAGLHYDSKLTVEELDEVQDTSDTAVVLDMDIDYEKRFKQGTDLRLGYSLSQKSYFNETEFNLQIHNVSLNIKQNLERFDVGLETYYVNSRLDNDEFLTFQHISPYFTTFLTRKLYLRGSYFYRDKTFAENPGRDGTVNAVDTDFYYFIDGVRHYVVAGYRYEDGIPFHPVSTSSVTRSNCAMCAGWSSMEITLPGCAWTGAMRIGTTRRSPRLSVSGVPSSASAGACGWSFR